MRREKSRGGDKVRGTFVLSQPTGNSQHQYRGVCGLASGVSVFLLSVAVQYENRLSTARRGQPSCVYSGTTGGNLQYPSLASKYRQRYLQTETLTLSCRQARSQSHLRMQPRSPWPDHRSGVRRKRRHEEVVAGAASCRRTMTSIGRPTRLRTVGEMDEAMLSNRQAVWQARCDWACGEFAMRELSAALRTRKFEWRGSSSLASM